MASAKDTREELEKLVKGSNDSLEGEMPPGTEEALKIAPSFTMDFKKVKKNCKRRARSMIKRSTGLMLSDETVAENPYMKHKMQVDIISLTGLLYQLEINEMMQETLMEEVRLGAAHPRMFEVFGNLSKTIGELNKQLIQTVEAIKLTYKDIKGDIREKEEELQALGQGDGGMMRNKDGMVTMGTKGLIREAKKAKMLDRKESMQEDRDIQDIEEIKE